MRSVIVYVNVIITNQLFRMWPKS